ncbi:ATP-binding protein [Porticoccus sp. W117]|uniref:two-component system sensor histidine kinase NtrB n=1 Tax=Porticoccus sp. W117 TaxID=3054777 RepID=UPI002591ACFE|nr:ATP-binding protein [Porticoccus sp. W117]MDM3871719.1 ATP-binding protein [Porticoccus sp. W117]
MANQHPGMPNDKDTLLAIIESLNDGVVVCDMEGNFTHFNKAANKIHGLGASSVDPDSWSNTYGMFKTDRTTPFPPEQLPLARAMAGETTHNVGMCIQKHGEDSPMKLIEVNGAPVISAEGEQIGAVVVFRDIEEKAQLQQQLLQAQKLEAIGQLAAGIAHEINTPVQFVHNNLEFLERSFGEVMELFQQMQSLLQRTSGSLAEEGKQLLEEADMEFLTEEIPEALKQSCDGMKNIAEIVSAMKGFSHPGSNNRQLVDINNAIENTLIVIRSECKDIIDFETSLDTTLPKVPGFPAELNQVLINIILNAVQAISGQLKEAGCAGGRITITTGRNQKKQIVIRIADTGPGISESIQHKIFDPFFTTKEVGQGTGQGLAIAHSIVTNKHKGSIEIESSSGKGATFTIKLPIAEVSRI